MVTGITVSQCTHAPSQGVDDRRRHLPLILGRHGRRRGAAPSRGGRGGEGVAEVGEARERSVEGDEKRAQVRAEPGRALGAGLWVLVMWMDVCLA